MSAAKPARVFPFALLRRAALPSSALLPLVHSHFVRDVLAERAAVEALRAHCAGALERLPRAQELAQPAARASLRALRRALRAAEAEALQRLRARQVELPAAVEHALTCCLEATARRQRSRREAEERAESTALTWARRVEVRAALVSASREFEAQLGREPSAPSGKRRRALLQTALRYFTRCARKASPRGRLGPVAFVQLDGHAAAEPLAWPHSAQARAVVHGGAIARAWQRWHDAPIARDEALWRSEAWSSPHGPALLWLRCQGERLRLERLEGETARQLALDVDGRWLREAAESSLPVAQQAHRHGWLERAVPQTDRELLEWLATQEEAWAHIQQLAERFVHAELPESRRALQEATAEAIERQDPVLAPLVREEVVAEDWVADGTPRLALSRAGLRGLSELACALDRWEHRGSRARDRAAAAWFAQQFAGQNAAPLLEVLARWRAHRPELPAPSACVEPADVAWAGVDEQQLELRFVGETPEAPPRLRGAYLACSDEQMVLESLAPGWGRGFGRYVHCAPDSVRSALCARAAGVAEFALRPAPGAPINARPSFGLEELRLPRAAPSTAPSLPMHALWFECHDGRLQLVDRRDGRVRHLVDLRQTQRVEQELESMLLELAAPVQLAWAEVSARLEASRPSWRSLADGLQAAPRWCGAPGLVLRRRRWLLEPGLVQDAEEYVGLASRHGLPLEQFVTLAAAATSRAGHKPRFVHLGVPVLIDDCLRHARRLGQPLLIEEALPARGLRCRDGEHAASLYLEWERAR